MATATLQYDGALRTTMTHGRSGEQIITDAPVDNHGKGEAFSPTDLVAASLLSCMVTVMGIKADKMGLGIGTVKGEVKKTMAANPRRIARLDIKISLEDHAIPEANRAGFEKTAIDCPVAKSLSPELIYDTTFEW